MIDCRRYGIPGCIVAANASFASRAVLSHLATCVNRGAFSVAQEARVERLCIQTHTHTHKHAHSWLASRQRKRDICGRKRRDFFPFFTKSSPFDGWLWMDIIVDRVRDTATYAPHARTHARTFYHTHSRLYVYACWPALPAVNDPDRI